MHDGYGQTMTFRGVSARAFSDSLWAFQLNELPASRTGIVVSTSDSSPTSSGGCNAARSPQHCGIGAPTYSLTACSAADDPPRNDAGGRGRPPRRRLRIVIADDHQVVRRGLELVLESEADFDVVAVAGDITTALAHVREFAPDVLVLDLNMPGGSVLRTIPTLRAEAPATQIVVLTMEADSGSVRAARRNGALGYVLKEAAESELADAVRRAAAGDTYLTRKLASKMFTEEVLQGPWD